MRKVVETTTQVACNWGGWIACFAVVGFTAYAHVVLS